uniref:Uncharacterized protein n=1 Tax=Gasterosteus aculeatus aculeatus TaxID=481459 RepID=A0AAQ4P5N7_GASAC
VGSPFSLQNSITTGILSDGPELGLEDSDMDYIQTDAVIHCGNSGGPLVNLVRGFIVLHSMKSDDTIIHHFYICYALCHAGRPGLTEKHIGVLMLQLSPSLIQNLKEREGGFPDVISGVYIYEVIPGGPASREAVRSDAPLSVTVRRKSEDVTLTVRLLRTLNDAPHCTWEPLKLLTCWCFGWLVPCITRFTINYSNDVID